MTAYLLVDAGLPERNLSGAALAYLEQRRTQAREGVVDPWSDEELSPALPDPVLRRQFVAELQPWPLSFFEEQVPVFPDWPDASCGYIRFTASYPEAVARAEAEGWPVIRFDGADHFHMLVDPFAVTEALLELRERLRG